MSYAGGDMQNGSVNEIRNQLQQNFNLSLWMLLPPLVVVVLEQIIKIVRDRGSSVAASTGSSGGTNILTGDVYLSIVLPGGCSHRPIARWATRPPCCRARSRMVERWSLR